jgi:hypothetical protein
VLEELLREGQLLHAIVSGDDMDLTACNHAQLRTWSLFPRKKEQLTAGRMQEGYESRA